MATRNFDIKIIEIGTDYEMKNHSIHDTTGICPDGTTTRIKFVRGSKDPDEKVKRVSGILHEQLLKMQILDLEYKNQLVPSRETSIVITKLQEALMWLNERSDKRFRAGSQGTYKE